MMVYSATNAERLENVFTGVLEEELYSLLHCECACISCQTGISKSSRISFPYNWTEQSEEERDNSQS